MKRRSFLQTSSAFSLPVLLNGLGINAITQSPLFNFLDDDSDRVLVLVNLLGGNDGLATMIPLDYYDNLANVRQNIIIPQSNLLQISDTNALHPSCTGLRDLYDDNRLAIVQNVGYPNQNRSHFRSTDIWSTASAADEFLTTGWIGRFFDNRTPGYPEGYPNADFPDPIAITLGYIVSETCQGNLANYSIAVTDPTSLTLLTESEESEVSDNCYGKELTFVRNAIKQTNAYSTSVSEAAEKGTNMSDLYPDNNDLADQLRTVAQLISGGLKTKIYVVSIGGFDTHANQVVNGNPGTGQHSVLLRYLSDAIQAFQDDLKLQGLEERVVGMTFSEFGRRIRSNVSFGTDHGTAAPVIVFGKCVTSDIIGDNPIITRDVSVQQGVPMQFDFRSVYGSILMDWFEIDEDEIKQILFEDFTYLPIIKGCSATSVDPAEAFGSFEIKAYPNPCRNNLTVSFESKTEQAKLSLFNGIGSELKVIFNKRLQEGKHDIPVDMNGLPSGNYFLQLISGHKHKTIYIQKF